MYRHAILMLLGLAGCAPTPQPVDVGPVDMADSDVEVDPIEMAAFEVALVVEACEGLYRHPNANPNLLHLTRIQDEATCKKVLSPTDLEPRWEALKAAVARGELSYDGAAAARCVDDVAAALGNGYTSWMYAGACRDVLTGFLAVGDPCSDPDLCPPRQECFHGDDGSKCWDRTYYAGCVDTHACASGEWCYDGCEPMQPKGGEGDFCVVYTDDGHPFDHCATGLVCPWLAWDKTEDFGFFLTGNCQVTHVVGEACMNDLDCTFGLRCDVPDCAQAPCRRGTCIAP